MDQRGVAQPVMALPRTVRHHMSIRATCRLWRDLLDANRQVVWQLDGPNRWRDPEWLAELRIDPPMERYIARVWDERRRPYEVALAGWPRYTLLAWMAEWPRDEQWAGRIVRAVRARPARCGCLRRRCGTRVARGRGRRWTGSGGCRRWSFATS